MESADMIDSVVCGDNLDVLPQIADESIDLIVTDPPYGIRFMGRDWDKAVPSVEVWKECLRVLKPGALAFVMCIPRQDCFSRMVVNLEDAGFNVGFSSIYWAYASGFPKAMSISKAVDKRLGAKREMIGKSSTCIGQSMTEMYGHREGRQWETANHVTAPATPQAKALDGSYAGYQPKPAVEVVIVAMKRLSERTYTDQALTNRKGVTWLDSGRIPFEGNGDRLENQRNAKKGHNFDGSPKMNKHLQPSPQGRFAPNLLVSEDVLNDGGNSKGSHDQIFITKKESVFGCSGSQIGSNKGYNDSGSFSRFFSLDSWWTERVKSLPESVRRTFPFLIVPKASKGEKNEGCEGLEPKFATAMNRRCKNCGHGELDGRRKGTCCDNPEYVNEPVRKEFTNHHPCVKPLKLGSYLVTIGSREGDLVLDPFGGTGWTGIVCKMLKRRYIVIEIEKDYCEISERRIAAKEAALV